MPPSFRPPYPLDIAATISDVERRLQTFLSGSDPDGTRLSEVLSVFTGRFDDVAVIGGMVRDFARVGAPGFHSDVDLVIDAPADEVRDFACEIGARTNVFGGNSIVLNGWELDFWAMESSWAAQEGHVNLSSLGDMLATTFFDHDAILYHINDGWTICASDYLERQMKNELEINLEINPSINGCLYRAARRMLGWELSAGPRLRGFIDANLQAEAHEWMASRERRKLDTPIIQRFSLEQLRAALLSATKQ